MTHNATSDTVLDSRALELEVTYGSNSEFICQYNYLKSDKFYLRAFNQVGIKSKKKTTFADIAQRLG